MVLLATAEGYAAFRRAHYHPATLLGLVAVLSLMIETYNKGVAAPPLVLGGLVAGSFIWYLARVEPAADPVSGMLSTVFIFVWIGAFGSFAALLLDPTLFPDRHGVAFLLAAVIVTVTDDVASLLVGSAMGRHQLAPSISPNKTWEGVIGGGLAAILMAVVVVHFIHPWTVSKAHCCSGSSSPSSPRSATSASRWSSGTSGSRTWAISCPATAASSTASTASSSSFPPRTSWSRRFTSAEPMRSVSLLGSTGSIGTQALDVIRADGQRFRVHALAVHRSADVLVAQANEFLPAVVVIGDPALYATVRDAVPAGTEVLAGEDGLAEAARGADVVLNAVVGFAGLPVTMAALEAGRRLALANKESLIAAAPVVQKARSTPGAEIVPVDSEHCALHQCLASVQHTTDVSRLLLTASGGPFRDWPPERLRAR